MKYASTFLAVVIILALLAPVIAPYDSSATRPEESLESPNHTYLLGTDLLGRDVLSRVLMGGQRTLTISALATTFAAVAGTFIGMISGFAPDFVDRLLRVFINAALAIPGIILALVVITLTEQSTQAVAFATGVALIAPFAQVTRAAVLNIRHEGYIEAAVAAGATARRVLLWHALPNIRVTLLAYTGVTFSYAMINSAALSFLGLGGDLVDWGMLLADGRLVFQTAPWVSLAPGIMMSLTVMSVNHLTEQFSQR